MSDGDAGSDDKILVFEDVVQLSGSKDDLWAFISNPENLVDCVPGAQDVERLSETEYTFVIEQSIGFFSAVFDGEVELVEKNEPDWIVADGSAYDRGTGSTFDVIAAMEMQDKSEDTVELAYSVEFTFTGGVASYASRWIRRVISSRVDQYFDNVRTQFNDAEEQEHDSFA